MARHSHPNVQHLMWYDGLLVKPRTKHAVDAKDYDVAFEVSGLCVGT